MNGLQCDNCRAFTPGITPGWLYLQEATGDALFGRVSAETVGTFCSVRCLSEYAYVSSVAEKGSG